MRSRRASHSTDEFDTSPSRILRPKAGSIFCHRSNYRDVIQTGKCCLGYISTRILKHNKSNSDILDSSAILSYSDMIDTLSSVQFYFVMSILIYVTVFHKSKFN
jgi:hypothetical protein